MTEEGYGERLLKKFGWFPGRGLGRSPVGEREAVFLSKPRPGRLGVGAELPGEELEAKRAALNIGDKVEVTRGKWVGSRGAVTEMEEDYVTIEIGLRKLHIPLLYITPAADLPAITANIDLTRKLLRWVIPGIRVRIISKTIRDGQLYSSKGVVQDVLDDCSFTLLTDSRELLDFLSERDIETLIPAIGKDVMVLRDEHRSEVGKLVERDKRRNRVVVQLQAAELLTLTQDDISELAK